mgnify:CR=1 FL=1
MLYYLDMAIKKSSIENQKKSTSEIHPPTPASEIIPEREIIRVPEKSPQQSEEEKKQSSARKVAPKAPVPAPIAPQPKSELLIEVEDILSEDMEDVFKNMSPDNQQKFKAKGEEIARTIWQMIETAKLQLKKVLTLLREWLKMVPGVNRYFLEQETKIKIDKIIDLVKKQKH